MYKIILSDIDFGKQEMDALKKVMHSKWLSMGPITKKFEEDFARFLNVKHAFAVSNCTAALHLAHKSLGIKKEDEVITTALTFVATSNSILYSGATPVFADIVSKDNLNISSEEIEKKITPRTKAITAIHYGGYPCDMKNIMRIAKEHSLFVIEDAAHAPGAEINNKKCGTIGDIGCFSFFANKNLVTGEGGMITTNNDIFAEKIKLMRSHGMTSLTWDRHKGHSYSYDVVDLGYNHRTTEIASALGIEQLKKLDKNNTKRKTIVKSYIEHLRDLPIKIPFVNYCNNSIKSSYHIFPILLPEQVPRNHFIDYLRKKGIQTSIHYPPIHLFSFYRKKFNFKEGMLPKTEFIGKHEVTLPLHPLMTEKDVKYTATTIKEYFKK